MRRADNEQHGKRWNRMVDHLAPRRRQAQPGGMRRSRAHVFQRKADSRDVPGVIPKNCG